jgi:hypothetical protein
MAMDLKEALETIKQGDWQKNLRFVTADTLRGTGGKVIELKKFRIAKNRSVSKLTEKSSQHEEVNRKDPRHNYHFTINLELENHQTRKVHPILITHLNSIPIL